MKLEMLYKKSSVGKSQFWEIRTEGSAIVTRWGQIGGKEQEARDVIAEGKNLGKANATTAIQQAELEAQSQWEKKLKKGYVKSLDDAQAGKTDSVIEGGIFPMLAKRYDEHGHKIVFPAYVQPKLDGHRCLAVVKDGKATLWSRTRQPITGLPHIVKEIEGLASWCQRSNFILDGELYNHAYKDRFEELSSFIRSATPKPGHEVVQYHIYDVPNFGVRDDTPQRERVQTLMYLRGADGVSNTVSSRTALWFVGTLCVQDEDEMMLAFERFLELGYEGLMVRNANGVYVNKRSADLQKVKEFEDQEFEVVGVKDGRGKLAGHAIFTCKANGDERMDSNGTFDAKMKGETAKLKEYFEHPERAIGRQLTVKFQGVTNKSRVPRFPIGLRFREDL